mgnify:CR=1 FL=1
MVLFCEIHMELVFVLTVSVDHTLSDFVNFHMHDVWESFFDNQEPGVSSSWLKDPSFELGWIQIELVISIAFSLDQNSIIKSDVDFGVVLDVASNLWVYGKFTFKVNYVWIRVLIFIQSVCGHTLVTVILHPPRHLAISWLSTCCSDNRLLDTLHKALDEGIRAVFFIELIVTIICSVHFNLSELVNESRNI